MIRTLISSVRNPARIRLDDLGQEPFRLFFPAGVLAGIVGVALWPLHLVGLMESYPGLSHARLMAGGFFGGFILGFLGTALPRMLGVRALGKGPVLTLGIAHLGMVAAYAGQRVFVGDVLFLALLVVFAGLMLTHVRERRDTPPPGFVLVGLGLLCAGAGGGLALGQEGREVDAFWITLQRLLSYQGFVLLPILGIGPFILPRLFGRESAHDFPEMLRPVPGWWRKAATALVAGVLVIGSFVLEAKGWTRVAHGIRCAAVLGCVALEMPWQRAAKLNALGFFARLAFAGIAAGFLAVALFPGYRTGLLHLALIGGFALLTLVVATRVVFGHSGNLARLQGPQRWLGVATGLMLLGMATRISGDFWPHVLASHYSYGAGLWIAGVLLWSVKVLPLVLARETEEKAAG